MGNSRGGSQAAKCLEFETIVRQGKLGEELTLVAEEIGATLIVLGGSTGPDADFQNSALQVFAGDLQDGTGVEVRFLSQSD